LDARLKTLLCEKNSAVKSKEVQLGCNLAEFSEEGYSSKERFTNADDDDDDFLLLLYVPSLITQGKTDTRRHDVVVSCRKS
jgi:hypothetical protein